MCGTLLETRPASRPEAPTPVGLNRPGANYPNPNPPRPNLPAINPPRQNAPSQDPPSADPLRQESFSGLDSFFEPERLQRKSGAWRVLLLLALFAGLGAAGWWTYSNYFGASGGQKPGSAASSETAVPSQETTAKPAASDAVPPLDAGPPKSAAPSASVPENQPDQANAVPASAPGTLDATAKPATQSSIPAKPAPAKPARSNQKIPRIALGDKSEERHEHKVTSPKASNLPAPATPAAPDLGDAAFHKGEAYLYGRGVKESCDEAMKYLKAASAKSNAKARSAFGTMYATGHCVPRDLPTSYSWFALALHADPNNQVLEKDLNQVWIQMTPSERQVALKTKP